MDKGFNDDELADIMSEIENLEQEFTGVAEETEAVAHSEAKGPIVESFTEKSAAESHDEVSFIHEAKPEKAISKASPKSKEYSQSQMNFSVSGDMKLDLSFNISGKVVHLNITDDCFELEFEEGMKFTIPVDQAHKKAA